MFELKIKRVGLHVTNKNLLLAFSVIAKDVFCTKQSIKGTCTCTTKFNNNFEIYFHIAQQFTYWCSRAHKHTFTMKCIENRNSFTNTLNEIISCFGKFEVLIVLYGV